MGTSYSLEMSRTEETNILPTQIKYEDGLRVSSLNSTYRLRIAFRNQSCIPAEIYWIDYDGEIRFYNGIKPGDELKMLTFYTHPWLIKGRGVELGCLSSAGNIVVWPREEKEEIVITRTETHRWSPHNHKAIFSSDKSFSKVVQTILLVHHVLGRYESLRYSTDDLCNENRVDRNEKEKTSNITINIEAISRASRGRDRHFVDSNGSFLQPKEISAQRSQSLASVSSYLTCCSRESSPPPNANFASEIEAAISRSSSSPREGSSSSSISDVLQVKPPKLSSDTSVNSRRSSTSGLARSSSQGSYSKRIMESVELKAWKLLPLCCGSGSVRTFENSALVEDNKLTLGSLPLGIIFKIIETIAPEVPIIKTLLKENVPLFPKRAEYYGPVSGPEAWNRALELRTSSFRDD